MPLAFDITVAILNWNGLAHLKEFLPSVAENSKEAKILLIDNCSTDESVSWVRAHFPHIEVRIHTKNLGFTEGYNQGLDRVGTKYCVLLNSDVEVSAGWLNPLLSRMNSDPKMAAVQPKILNYKDKSKFEYAGASGGYIDTLGYPFCRGRIFDWCEPDENQYDNACPVFWASGACMMVRMAAYREMGGLEPRFFAHMEEIDLCWRWQNSGYKVWVEPGSVVYHLGAGTLSKANPRKTFLNFRNGFAMLYMNTLGTDILWKIPFRLVLDGIAGVQFLLKGEWKNMWAIVRAHFAFYGSLGYWQKNRIRNQHNANQPNTTGFWQGSIVFAFFIKGQKTFAKLQKP